MWYRYWFCLILLFIAMPVQAISLAVVATEPVNGGRMVSPGEQEIVITFSHPMKMNSWSFVETEAGVFPPVIAEPVFRGPTVCVLQVRLEPGETYSLGLNSQTRSGFRLAADEKVTLPPYVLTFSVAAGTPGLTLDTTEPPPPPLARPGMSPSIAPPFPAASQAGGVDPRLTGTWLFRDDEEEIVVQLNPDGRFYVRNRYGEEVEESIGDYAVGEGVIYSEDESGEQGRYPYHFPDPETLELDLSEQGEPLQLQLIRVEDIPELDEWQPVVEEEEEEEETSAIEQGESPTAGQTSPPGRQDGLADQLLLRRYTDRSENAFTILVPDGWLTSGGILRVNPLEGSGPAQSIAAKLDFSVASDQQGTVMLRWIPSAYYIDTRFMPAGPLFPQGSSYMGMTVHPAMTPAEFNTMVFQNLRGNAQGIQVEEQRELPGLAGLFDDALRQAGIGQIGIRNSAGLVSLVYQEGGRTFREKIVTVIEDMGQLAAGMWSNKLTVAARAPIEECDDWAPVLWLIANSSTINPQWLEGELRGQITRGGKLLEVQREVHDIGRAITEHRQKTNAEIMNDMHLTLMGQEEYVNPFTNAVEVGTNQYQHRWVNNLGDVLYTNQESYDPNIDPAMHATNFRRSAVRPR